MKCGMSCSLFEVVDGKGKPTSGTLAALIHKLERDRMVSHPLAATYHVFMLENLREVQNQFTESQFAKEKRTVLN